jgi:quinol monooxygenase YgiN
MATAPGVLALLKAKPEKAEELGSFLESSRDLAAAEEGTVTWYAFRVDETTFGVFDTFTGEDGRDAHMKGEIATRLGEKAGELLDTDPDIRFIDVIARK